MDELSSSSFAHFGRVWEDGDFKTSSGSVVSHKVVNKMSWHLLFDLRDRFNSFWSVASSTTIVDSHGVFGSVSFFDGFWSRLGNTHFNYYNMILSQT